MRQERHTATARADACPCTSAHSGANAGTCAVNEHDAFDPIQHDVDHDSAG